MERGKRRWKPAGPRPPRRPRSAGGPSPGGRLSPRTRLHPHLEGGEDPHAPGPPPASSSFAQRRLQAFIPTVREEPKPPPTERPEKTRKDRIFPETKASQTRFQFNPAGNLLHLHGLRFPSAEITQRRA